MCVCVFRTHLDLLSIPQSGVLDCFTTVLISPTPPGRKNVEGTLLYIKGCLQEFRSRFLCDLSTEKATISVPISGLQKLRRGFPAHPANPMCNAFKILLNAWGLCVCVCFQNAPRPSEHPLVRGKKCQNVLVGS